MLSLRTALLTLLLTTPVLAGCLGDGDDLRPAGLTTDVPGRLLAHVQGERVPVPAGWEDLLVRLAPTGFRRGEPTVGVSSTGTIFATAGPSDNVRPGGYGQIARSTDHGQTWALVQDPVMSPKASLDPWLWVDPDTDRVFNGPLYVVCSWIAWSDDEGDTWDANPLGGCGVPAHDHQKITTGPPPEGVTTMGYPNIVYYQYNSFRGEGTIITTSLDGGRTFSLGSLAHPSDCYGGIAGPTGVAPDGTAYSPKPTCGGVRIAKSTDGGATWGDARVVDDAGIAPDLTTVDIDVDDEGNAYVVYQGGDSLLYLTTTSDQGATWSAPKRVSPPDVTTTVFAAIAVGDAGRVGIAYLGTDHDRSGWDSEAPSDASDDTVWHLYTSFSEDALAATPTFVTHQATPDDDPVQVGCVWLRGGSNDCRNLRDFIDAVEHEGRLYVAYADGCDGCDAAEDSRARGETTVAIVEAGPGLREGRLTALTT